MTKTVLHQILDRASFSPRTKGNYQLVIDRWVEFAGPNPANWTRDRAQEFYDSLLEGGLKTQSANVYLASLRYVSRWYATKMQNPQLDFAVVQRRRGKVKREGIVENAPILDEDEARALILDCSSDDALDRRDRAMLVLGLETGMRRISFIGAAFEGLKTARGYPTLRVPIKGSGGEETFDVPLSDTALAALENWLDWLRKSGVKSGEIFRRLAAQAGGRYVVDRALSLTGINEIIAKRSEAAGIRHVNPHLLRHTFISWRSRAGLSPLDISEITGHKVTSVVVNGVAMNIGGMQPYIHHDVNTIRNATPAWLRDLVASLLAR